MSGEYEAATRDAYQDERLARAYKQQTVGRTWARVATRRELRLVAKALASCRLDADDMVMDAPCGTGIAGVLFERLDIDVVGADISMQMMALAGREYAEGSLRGLVRTDLATLPFRNDAFAGALVLGFMHRLPSKHKRQVMRELGRVLRDFLVVTFSIDSAIQRIKKLPLEIVQGPSRSAPHPIPREEIADVLAAGGFRVRRARSVLPLLSSEVVVLAERAR